MLNGKEEELVDMYAELSPREHCSPYTIPLYTAGTLSRRMIARHLLEKNNRDRVVIVAGVFQYVSKSFSTAFSMARFLRESRI